MAEEAYLGRQLLRRGPSLRICQGQGLLRICQCGELRIVRNQLGVHDRGLDLCSESALGDGHGQRPAGSSLAGLETARSAVLARTIVVRRQCFPLFLFLIFIALFFILVLFLLLVDCVVDFGDVKKREEESIDFERVLLLGFCSLVVDL
ncbi:hypothetical protein RJT34_02937 [Clitoria ternatea]|uniref:Uncharacterized protein n=1 Tax=Clitoria ternatea TaxID=43366 RepID=A0AAN9KL88_CLITE